MIILYTAMIGDPDDKLRFEHIYIENRDIMYSYAFRILGNSFAAEDAVHDAFMSYAKYYERYISLDDKQTRNLLIIIVKNASFRIYNIRKKEIDTDEVYTEETLPDISVDTEERDTKRLLFDMIKSLDSKYGDVIMLKYYYGLGVREIADSLGISQENVKVRLHRARALLKKKIEEAGIYE